MPRWSQFGWACFGILAFAEYQWLATIDKIGPPIPEFLWPIVALTFPATVLAMGGSAVFVAGDVVRLFRRQRVPRSDLIAAIGCGALISVILRW